MATSSESLVVRRARDWIWWIAAVLVAIVVSLEACWFSAACGPTSLAWDEGEYVLAALNTADRLEGSSLTHWPHVVRHDQHYAKPPLLVNILAAWLVLLGPSHLMSTIAGNALTTSLALYAIVALWAGRLCGGRGAFLGVLAVGAMPILGRIAAQVFPEPLVLLLVVATAATLLWPAPRWPAWRIGLLGVEIGLGLLAKASFPALIVGPLLVWLLLGATLGVPRFRARLAILIAAGFVGVALAWVWYGTNWREALDYVRSAHAFNLHPAWSREQVLSEWARTLTWETFGGCGVVLILASFTGFASRRTDPRRLSGLALIAAGIPMLAAGLSSANVASRLQLPAAGAVLLGAAILTSAPARKPLPKLAWLGLVVLVALQWTAVQGAPLWRAFTSRRNVPCAAVVDRLDPIGRSRGISCPDGRPALAVVDAMGELAELGLWPVCRLATNHRELNVGVVEVTAAARELPARFAWATYFSWDAAKRTDALELAKRTPTVVAALFPGRHWGAPEPALNVYVDEVLDFVRDRSNGFSIWRRIAPEDGAFTLFLLRNFDPESLPPLHPLAAEFGSLIQINGFATDRQGLFVDCMCIGRTSRNWAVAIRGVPAAAADLTTAPAFVVDVPIQPPTSGWRPGRRYRVRLPVRDFAQGTAYTVTLSLFDPDHPPSGSHVPARTDAIWGRSVVLPDVAFGRAETVDPSKPAPGRTARKPRR